MVKHFQGFYLHFLLQFISTICFSQQIDFLKSYFIDRSYDGGSRIVRSDDRLVIAGYTALAVGGYSSVLLSNDTNGNNYWSKIYNSGIPRFLDVDSLKNIYIIGSGQPQLMKTDQYGNIIWAYHGSSGDYFGGAALLKNDGSILIGHGSSLSKLDNNANVLWTINYLDTIRFIDIQECSNGDLYLAGVITEGNGQNDIFILKTDSVGSIIWNRQIGNHMDDGVGSICVTPDLGVAVAGYIADSIPPFNYALTLLKFNALGTIQWHNCFSTGASRIRPTSDGGFILSGMTNYFEDTTSSDGFYLKTDSLGNIVWTKRFAGNAEENVDDLLIVNDSDLYITGFSYSIATGVHDIYLLRTNINSTTCMQGDGIDSTFVIPFQNYNRPIGTSAGSFNLIPSSLIVDSVIAQVTEWCSTVNIKFKDETEVGFSLFPNPANSQFTIGTNSDAEVLQVSIIDVLGKTIHSEKYIGADEYVIDKKLISGLYLVNLIIGKKHYSRKLLVQ